MTKTLGVPLRPQIAEPLPKVDDNSIGYGWRLSDAARCQIRQMEEQNAANVARLLRDGFRCGRADQ